MGGLVNAMEFQILYRKFDVRVGGRNDVNYISFCQMIDDYAQTCWSAGPGTNCSAIFGKYGQAGAIIGKFR